ncbi:hypothetical protein V1318_13225 [Lysobacter sp. CCNWLW3]|uniref:hypothetical protein n=1 Tax=unclassified Lysobacter TaxID=2635362 RepID=UPI002FD7486E
MEVTFLVPDFARARRSASFLGFLTARERLIARAHAPRRASSLAREFWRRGIEASFRWRARYLRCGRMREVQGRPISQARVHRVRPSEHAAVLRCSRARRFCGRPPESSERRAAIGARDRAFRVDPMRFTRGAPPKIFREQSCV